MLISNHHFAKCWQNADSCQLIMLISNHHFAKCWQNADSKQLISFHLLGLPSIGEETKYGKLLIQSSFCQGGCVIIGISLIEDADSMLIPVRKIPAKC